ncbi:L,D-transpeptidase family protein [Rhodobacter sp. Har01]|uniref:L,D-transpeptidase family protein n=1 Tax=Rhodobacter sp. Har01 TaxID=2883999 RepID=UPI001D07A6B2|nr:L,D-transpeptidase family protein [Rhodobacter sp. Har01]MCB6177044.1 L,D-transpeptidase family protein [Rhodobacter sp. Har01]
MVLRETARCRARQILCSATLALGLGLLTAEATVAETATSTAFAQSLAASAADEAAVADWYRQTAYDTLWTGAEDADRRAALFAALDTAADHGLPPARYDAAGLRAGFAAAETEGDLGRLEVAMTRAYLAWARDLTSGLLEPRKIDPSIVREIAVEDPQVLLRAIAGDDPATVLRGLVPSSNVYAQLMKAKIGLEAAVAAGGWGPAVPGGALGPGDSGPAVVALRDRLAAMGYLERTPTQDYDRDIQRAVQSFQLGHGLPADGVAGETTLAEVNVAVEDRLKAVIVAMERERWLDIDRSVRHIWVNQPDFTARIVDHGRTVFRTRVVIGKNQPDQRSPEFSDEMEHIVVNPSWGVPRSITVKEYLPLLQRNPNAVGHLQVIDGRGRVVSRGAVNFAAYNARNFPFALRQPPSDGNALGKVKFMFPNPYNIYLHDTPSKSLFDTDVRAYSHGCIRVADPFDLAHALLSVQSAAVEEEFQSYLKGGAETLVKFEKTVPVHLVYYTAYPEAKGRMGFRRDVYGRDAKLWQALAEAGVELGAESQ